MAIAPTDKHFLVVVADEARAVLYTRETRSGPLREYKQLSNESARMKSGDLMSDRGGRAFDSFGQGRHTMGSEKTDPKAHSATVFAREVADAISADLHSGTCRGFALVAAPRFLGELRDAIAHATKTEPYAAIDKEVVGQSPDVIARLLADA